VIVVIVRTPRRLHLGIIDPTGSLGRKFGSIGVALEGGYDIKVTPAGSLTIEADKEDREVIEKIVKELNLEYETGLDYYIEVRKSIPRHIGLGSTTQLTLAIASAILRIAKKDIPIEEVAFSLKRARESGAGLYIFKFGGFVVDGGVKDTYPPLIMRHDFPENWAFILVIPKVKRGLSEEEEEGIMFGSNFGNVNIAKEITYRLMLGLVPSLIEKNIEKFGRFLTDIQELVGKHFATFQGGTFREDIKTVVEILKETTYGAGQSSWGPTVYGLIRKEEYNSVRVKVADLLDDYGIKAEIELGIPRNKGAEVLGENLFLERLISGVK